MTVKDLIKKLKKLPPDAIVKTWNDCSDCEDFNVVVSKTREGIIFILNVSLGEEL